MFSDRIAKCDYMTTLGVDRDWGLDFKRLIEERWADIKLPDCNLVSYEGGWTWMIDAITRQGLDRQLIKPLLLLRNPLEMRLSGLAHMHRYHGYDPHADIAAELAGGPLNGYVLANYQTRQLACPAPQPPEWYPTVTRNTWQPAAWKPIFDPQACPAADLAAATAAVDETFWVGLTEYYDASICVLAYQLGLFNSTQCDCSHRAAGAGTAAFHQTPQEVKSSYQFSLLELEALASMNRVDALLYGHAVGRLMRDVSEVEAATGTRLLCLQ